MSETVCRWCKQPEDRHFYNNKYCTPTKDGGWRDVRCFEPAPAEPPPISTVELPSAPNMFYDTASGTAINLDEIGPKSQAIKLNAPVAASPEGPLTIRCIQCDEGLIYKRVGNELQFKHKCRAAKPSAKVEEIVEQIWESCHANWDGDTVRENIAAILRPYIPEGPPPVNDILAWLDDALNSLRTRQYDNVGVYLKEAMKLCKSAAPSAPSPAPGNPYGDGRMRCIECQEPVCDHIAEKLMPALKANRLAGEATEGPEQV